MKPSLLLLIILLLFSCKNEPDPIPVDIFTYSDQRAFTNNENWIIAWNSKGELLDYKKYTRDEVVTLKSTGDVSDNKITIGFLTYNNVDNYKSHDIIIYTDIPPGQTFTYGTTPSNNTPTIDYTKTFNLNVTSSDGIYHNLRVSDASGYLMSGASGAGDLQCDVTIAPVGEYNAIYRSYDAVGHKILSNVKAGDVVNLTGSDFIPYEHQQTYTYPAGQVYFFLKGYTSEMPPTFAGVVLDNHYPGGESTSFTTGYYGALFTRFATTFGHSTNSGRSFFEFGKIGGLPTKMNVPDPVNISVTSKNPFNMAISVPSNALFHEVKWGNQLYEGSGPKTAGYVQWRVIGVSAEVKAELPVEILTTYPLLKIDASHYKSAQIFVGPQTYNEYVSVQLNGNWWDEFEQTTMGSR